MKKNILKAIASILCSTLFLTSFACSGSKKEVEQENQTSTTLPTVTAGEYLYEDGISEYTIVIPDDATDYEYFAANELANNLKNATGNKLPIVEESALKKSDRVVSLGHTQLWDENVGITLSDADIIDSGYYIKTVKNNVYISVPDSASTSGVLYGVYDFLNHIIGYEFYAADEIYYEEKQDIPLLNYAGNIVNPTFEMRMLPKADLRDDSDTTKRYRMMSPNSSFGLITWGHGQASQYIDPDAPCTCGLDGCGRGKTYQEHHPDWFSGYGTKEIQLCWTGGEDLERVAAEKFIQFFQVYPNAQYFMFGQEDNKSTCTCDRCLDAIKEYGGKPSGLQVAFMNNIIERTTAWLAENQPGRRVKYIIYAYYGVEEAPVTKDENGNTVAYSDKVIPTDDLYIFYTPIGANFAFQIDSPRNADVYQNLSDWSVIADGQLIMYLYDINFRHYLINFNNFGTAKGMYETCKEFGVACISSQAADSYSICFTEMRSYVESSLMWNLDLSYDDLVRKFMSAYYKDAAEYIYEYYKIMRDRYAYFQNAEEPDSGGIYGDINSTVLWTQPVIEKIDAAFDKALESIAKYEKTDYKTYELLKNRIMKERLSPIYIKISLLSSYYSAEEIAQFRADFKHYATLFKLSELREGAGFGDLLD